jgi:hypothetical protein
MSTPPEVKWCRWCNQEHAIYFLCDEGASALKDLANLGEGARPMSHFPPGATMEDLGVDPDTVEFLGGLGFNGGAVEVNGQWQIMLIIQGEDLDGKQYPARIMVTPVDGFERLRAWTVEIFDQTIARTKKLNEEGQ